MVYSEFCACISMWMVFQGIWGGSMAYFVFFRNLLEERILDLVLFLLMLNNIRSMLVIIFFWLSVIWEQEWLFVYMHLRRQARKNSLWEGKTEKINSFLLLNECLSACKSNKY